MGTTQTKVTEELYKDVVNLNTIKTQLNSAIDNLLQEFLHFGYVTITADNEIQMNSAVCEKIIYYRTTNFLKALPAVEINHVLYHLGFSQTPDVKARNEVCSSLLKFIWYKVQLLLRFKSLIDTCSTNIDQIKQECYTQQRSKLSSEFKKLWTAHYKLQELFDQLQNSIDVSQIEVIEQEFITLSKSVLFFCYSEFSC